jgi:hypothetical protein
MSPRLLVRTAARNRAGLDAVLHSRRATGMPITLFTKMNSLPRESLDRTQRASSLTEVLVAVALVGTLFLTLYAVFSSGFAVIQTARENLRATQILQEKMETIRLYSWAQLTSNGFIPKTFTAPFYAAGGKTNLEAGLSYTGLVEIAPAPVGESYSNDLKYVKITLLWSSGNLQHSRDVKTLVSRYGLQNYVY